MMEMWRMVYVLGLERSDVPRIQSAMLVIGSMAKDMAR